MAKNYGAEYPERPLMAVLSDLLAIEHFTTSRGSTVRSDFLQAVLQALGGDPTGLNKDDLIRSTIEAATHEPFDETLVSPGGTVTNRALQVMIDGITRHGLGRARATNPTVDVVERIPDFDPGNIADERSRQVAERAAREGQDRFRTAVIEAYGHTCAITQDNAVTALEAAHITPYLGPATNVLQNGICLRADIHRLWDRGQLAIDEASMKVVISDALRATSYVRMEGQVVGNLPRARGDRPSSAALRAHREWCHL